MLGVSYLSNGEFDVAENILKEVTDFSQRFGTEIIGTLAQAGLGAIAVAKGRLSWGIRMLEDGQGIFLKSQRRCFFAQYECILGKVYLQTVERARPITLSIMAKEMRFLAKDLPFASKKAEDHFHRAIEVAREIGARSVLGQAYLDLGFLHQTKGKRDKAKACFSEAISLFEECESEVYLKKAEEALASLG